MDLCDLRTGDIDKAMEVLCRKFYREMAFGIYLTIATTMTGLSVLLSLL